MYLARMVISAVVIVIPILMCLAILYLALTVVAFRKGRDHLNRRIGWRFLWMSALAAVLLGVPGSLAGILFGFIYQGESMTYSALSMTPENVLLTGCIGLELGCLAAMIVSFVITTRPKKTAQTLSDTVPTSLLADTETQDVVDEVH